MISLEKIHNRLSLLNTCLLGQNVCVKWLIFLSRVPGEMGMLLFLLFPFVVSAIRCGEKMSLCSVPLRYQQSV